MLRGRPLGEADRVYTLLTRERGKVDAVAKGMPAAQELDRRPARAAGRGARRAAPRPLARRHHRGAHDHVALDRPGAGRTRSRRPRCSPRRSTCSASPTSRCPRSTRCSPAPSPRSPRARRRRRSCRASSCGCSTRSASRRPPTRACAAASEFDEHGAWLDLEGGGLGCERCYGARGDAHALERRGRGELPRAGRRARRRRGAARAIARSRAPPTTSSPGTSADAPKSRALGARTRR